MKRALGLALGERLDRAFVRLALTRPSPATRRALEALGPRLAEVGAFYRDALESGRLYPKPPAAAARRVWRGDIAGGEVVDLSWESAFEPLGGAYREALARCPQTKVCHARWYRHPPPSPAVIMLHGWGGGRLGWEARAFDAPWFFERGLDVVLMTLPFHGLRSLGRRGKTPQFPSVQPERANEGFAQAISDIRALVALLRERGAPQVGAMGMSLGGFTSALLATVAPEVDYCAPLMPFGSLPQLLLEQNAGGGGFGFDVGLYEDAFGPTTPLRREAAIEPERIFLGTGLRDRVTPAHHARALHAHFEGSTLETYPGAHLLQVGRKSLFERFVSWRASLAESKSFP
mgnify:CR=1 FL=1